MLYIFIDNLPSHTVSHCSSKIPIFPEFPRPQPLLDPRKFAKQLPSAYTLYCSYHLPYRILWVKRYQYMNMIYCYLHFHDLHPIFFAYFLNQLFRSLPYLIIFEYLLTIFWTPYQMICCVIDRMTRPSQSHALCYTTSDKSLCGLGRLPVSLITLWVRHVFIPVASHGGFYKAFAKNHTFNPIANSKGTPGLFVVNILPSSEKKL